MGFAFVSRQMLFAVGGDEFFVDIILNYLKLFCYLVVESNSGAYKPLKLGNFVHTLGDADLYSNHVDQA